MMGDMNTPTDRTTPPLQQLVDRDLASEAKTGEPTTALAVIAACDNHYQHAAAEIYRRTERLVSIGTLRNWHTAALPDDAT